MSWDVYLHKKKWMDDKIEVGNHTYNVSPMYSKAMGITISDLDGKKCNEVLPLLIKGRQEMIDNPEIYKKMNPPNGWGSYETAVLFLGDIIIACEKHKDYKIEVC